MKIRVFRWLAVVGLAGVFATTAIAAGNAHQQRTAGIKVGVSLAGYSTDFWSSYVAFEKAAAKQYGVTLVGPISANGDAGKQATQIRALIDQGVNALIINPVDSAAIEPTLAYAASRTTAITSLTPPRRQQSTWQTSIAPSWSSCLKTTRFWTCSPVATRIGATASRMRR